MLKLYMLKLWRFSVIALNHYVSGRSHFIEIISPFLFCRLLNRPAFRVRVLSGVINNVPFLGKNSEYYALVYQSTHMRSA